MSYITVQPSVVENAALKGIEWYKKQVATHTGYVSGVNTNFEKLTKMLNLALLAKKHHTVVNLDSDDVAFLDNMGGFAND